MMATKKKNNARKAINLALQGGGAHGAFAWGAIDHLLADNRIDIEAISATSAATQPFSPPIASPNAVWLMVGGHSGRPTTLGRPEPFLWIFSQISVGEPIFVYL